MIIGRRGFLAGLGALIAAPAIVRASVIMPVKPMLFVPEPKIITDLTFQIEGYVRESDLDNLGKYNPKTLSYDRYIETDYRTAVKNCGIGDIDSRWERLTKREGTEEFKVKYGRR